MGIDAPTDGIRRDGGNRTATRVREAERPGEAIVRAVATATDRHPLELRPLYHAIDPDAVDALFEGSHRRIPSEPALRFVYEGCRVRLDGERVQVREVPDED